MCPPLTQHAPLSPIMFSTCTQHIQRASLVKGNKVSQVKMYIILTMFMYLIKSNIYRHFSKSKGHPWSRGNKVSQVKMYIILTMFMYLIKSNIYRHFSKSKGHPWSRGNKVSQVKMYIILTMFMYLIKSNIYRHFSKHKLYNCLHSW